MVDFDENFVEIIILPLQGANWNGVHCYPNALHWAGLYRAFSPSPSAPPLALPKG